MRRSGGGEQILVPLSAVKLLGRHLLADVAAAAAVASLAGVEPEAMTRAVEGFTGLEHALEPVTELGGVRFVNDSKATNIESALRAIQSFDTGLVVILGGKFKGGDFADLRDALKARAASVVAIGEAAPLIHQALEPAVPVHDAADMVAAVRTAFAVAAPRRHRAAGAGVRQLRHVRELRRAGPRLQARSHGVSPRNGARRGSSESSRHQSGRGGEELAAGNAGCPGLRGRCLPS